MDINLWAVLVCAIFQFLLGGIWYAPLFGKAWQKEAGLSDEQLKSGAAKAFILAFVTSFIMAYVLAHIIGFYNGWATVNNIPYGGILDGVQAGFYTWLGFVATVLLMNNLFERRSLKFYLINALYQLISLIGMGIILVWWKN